MNIEEIMLKLGIRTDSFSQGAARAKAEVTNLGEHVNKSLSAKSGEGLKNLFQELTSMSPMLGNAMQLAFNPIVAGFAVAAGVFTTARERLREWNAELDKQGELAEKPVGKMRDALFAARGRANESGQQFDWWKKDLLEGKPGEVEQEAIRQRIEAARVASGGDAIKFSQAKLAIMAEEKAKAEQQKAAALGRSEELQKNQEDVNVLATAENRKAKIQDRLKEEERLAQAIKDQELKVKKLSSSAASRVSGELYEGNQVDAMVAAAGALPGVGGMIQGAQLAREKAKLDEMFFTRQKTIEERKKLEEADLSGSSIARENAHNLKETQAEADRAKSRSLELDRAIAEEKKAIFAEERKRREEDTKNQIEQAEKKAGADKVAFLNEKMAIQDRALAKAKGVGDLEETRKLENQMRVDRESLSTETLNKQKAQEKLDRDIQFAQSRRAAHVNEPFLSTFKELSGMAAWDPMREREAEQQRMEDMREIGSGSAYASKFAEQARELELTEDEARRALLVDGPESRRYKDLVKKSESLKKGIEGSGLVKGDLALEKIDKNIADLLESARKEGLVVQPVNGK
jgi:hypothetical protein